MAWWIYEEGSIRIDVMVLVCRGFIPILLELSRVYVLSIQCMTTISTLSLVGLALYSTGTHREPVSSKLLHAIILVIIMIRSIFTDFCV